VEFEENVKRHRQDLVQRLCVAVKRFIEGIQNHMFLFPLPVKWVVKQLHVLLTESRKMDARQVKFLLNFTSQSLPEQCNIFPKL